MAKIVCKIKTKKGGWKFLKNEDGSKQIFSSFKKAEAAACPDFLPNGKRKIRQFKAHRIDINVEPPKPKRRTFLEFAGESIELK